jgi:hypothetical protein
MGGGDRAKRARERRGVARAAEDHGRRDVVGGARRGEPIDEGEPALAVGREIQGSLGRGHRLRRGPVPGGDEIENCRLELSDPREDGPG